MIVRDVAFRDRYGLHPRAAHRIQQALAGAVARVTFEDVARHGSPIDARSMLGLISSGIGAGDPVRISADGPDEEEIAASIAALLEAGVCHP